MQVWAKATLLCTGDLRLKFIVPNGCGFVNSHAFVFYVLENKVFVMVTTEVAVKC
jgi:hypothetical protein